MPKRKPESPPPKPTGGKRSGAGRPPGAKNKATLERELRAAAGVKAALNAGLMPLDVMLKVMRGDAEITARQYEAARDAAPYLHPRLSAVAQTTMDDLTTLSDADLVAARRKLAQQVAAEAPKEGEALH